VIPVNEPLLGDAELANVQECIRSGWISSAGAFIDRFEKAWAAYCGRAHGISVSNGTVALQAAVEALRLEPGSEIVMPAFTIISCALAALYNQCTPVLVDCDPETWCLDVSQLASAIGPRTRAIMPVHIYGHPVDMDPLLEVADRHQLAVIEDAAEAHGASYRGRRCGSFGNVSTFSFYANKIVTTGEGGMLVTDDEQLAGRARSFRNLQFRPERRFYHTELGQNFRFTNLQAAVGLGQLSRIDDVIDRKRRTARRYSESFRTMDQLQLPVEREWAFNVYWMYGVVLRPEVRFDAAELARRLSALGVETRPFFLGLHEQPALLARGHFAGQRLPVTETIASRGLYLPSGPTLTEAQQDQVVDAVRAALRDPGR
jgi:perosamine synthetase